MALQDLLDLSAVRNQKKIGISEERIEKIKPVVRDYISFWRDYPDLFVDFMQTGGDWDKPLTFRLFFYQRVFLRVAMRYKYTYAVFPRACLVDAPTGNFLFPWTNFFKKGNPLFNI